MSYFQCIIGHHDAGLVISALCGDENTALQVSVATFYPVLVLSGKTPAHNATAYVYMYT